MSGYRPPPSAPKPGPREDEWTRIQPCELGGETSWNRRFENRNGCLCLIEPGEAAGDYIHWEDTGEKVDLQPVEAAYDECLLINRKQLKARLVKGKAPAQAAQNSGPSQAPIKRHSPPEGLVAVQEWELNPHHPTHFVWYNGRLCYVSGKGGTPEEITYESNGRKVEVTPFGARIGRDPLIDRKGLKAVHKHELGKRHNSGPSASSATSKTGKAAPMSAPNKPDQHYRYAQDKSATKSKSVTTQIYSDSPAPECPPAYSEVPPPYQPPYRPPQPSGAQPASHQPPEERRKKSKRKKGSRCEMM